MIPSGTKMGNPANSNFKSISIILIFMFSVSFHCVRCRKDFYLSRQTIISGMGWPVDMERKGCESSIHDDDIDICVTMVGWVDVLDGDQGDFRRRRAMDISSF